MEFAASQSEVERWWHGSVGYQIYIRSFADSNADGIGDLNGIRGRLSYLADLGIDFIWITPCFPSPMYDWGYDVADYCDIDPRFGTLDDFDALIAEAKKHNIRVLLDLVPNHSSEEHRWFQDARTGRDSEYRDYYIWADPAEPTGPDKAKPDQTKPDPASPDQAGDYPNNWIGYFGGPAWTFDETSGQYYMHLFLPQQPDLNWRNPAVLDEFDKVLRFWLDHGASGFRIDVAGGLVKDDQFRSNPQIAPWDPAAGRAEQWLAFEHRHDVFQPESHTVFRRWRKICDEYDAYLLGETYTHDPQVLADLVPGDGMHGGFWFEPMHIEWEGAQIRRSLAAPVELLSSKLLWATSSHDLSRSPTRFGGSPARASGSAADTGRERTLALNVLLSCLPGVPVLYQGEELGLVDGQIPPGAMLDPVDNSRDVCRTPMPWSPGPNNGFTTGEAWLSSAPRADEETAQAQLADPDSWLSCYTKLLAARRSLPEFADQSVEWTDGGSGPVVSYRRKLAGQAEAEQAEAGQTEAGAAKLNVAANISSDTQRLTVPPGATIAYATPGVVHENDSQLLLVAHGAVILY